MPFKSLNIESLAQLIQDLKLGVTHHRMFGTVFYEVFPKQPKTMRLKESYKPSPKVQGLYSIYQANIAQNTDTIQFADQKLRDNHFYGQYYNNGEGSLKLHISLNNIGNLDEKVIQGLMKLLIEESESPNNNMSFFFKIIDPESAYLERFANNDQLTLYFDKYTSAGDMARLAKKVEEYLHSQNVPDNQQPLGPKDSFGLNSFVSARFDTNKLLHEYNVYPFFDVELQKFFNRYTPEELTNIPICAFEAVFNYVIMSNDILELSKEPKQGLNEADSAKVQAELDKMKENPKQYMDVVHDLQDKTTEKDSNETKYVDLDTANQRYLINFKDLLNLKASTYTIMKNDLKEIKNSAPDFYKALKKLHVKSTKLPKDSVKAAVAATLYKELVVQYLNFHKKNINYDTFKNNCITSINDASPTLKEHRWWKEIILNILTAIGTLGGSLAYQYGKSENQQLFFKVNTASMNIAEGIQNAIEDLKPKSGG